LNNNRPTADDLAVKIEATIPTATQATRDRFVIQMPLSVMSLSPCVRGHVTWCDPSALLAVDHWFPTGGPLTLGEGR